MQTRADTHETNTNGGDSGKITHEGGVKYNAGVTKTVGRNSYFNHRVSNSSFNQR